MAWRDNVDPMIKNHLELQIKESAKFNSYKKAKNPALAQLWVAVANLSKQIFDLNLKLNYLENALKDLGRSKEEKYIETAEKILGISKHKTKVKKKRKKKRK